MSGGLRATPVTAAEGLALAARAETADPTADLAGSLVWLQAATDVLGADALQHVVFADAAGHPVGCVALQRTRAAWRSGSPGRATLQWPFGPIGFGFRPRWFGAPSDGWFAALRTAFRDERLDLQRCAPEAGGAAVLPAGAERAPGIGTWTRRDPGTAEQWLAGLYGKHRRDLAKYRRDIAKAGGVFADFTAADPAALDACFQLHRSRLHDKGARSEYFAAAVESFLRALALRTAGDGLRLTLLQREGRCIASCLSFVHHRRFKAFVSGWDRAHSRLDLGRQVLYHQLLAELPRGLDEIDFLGGDLAYKREFGLEKAPTVDLVHHGDRLATLRAHVVRTALSVYRRARGRVPAGIR